MTNEPNFIAGQPSEGKVGALIAWALFILSIPSANVLVLIGLVVSYVTRGTATGVARHVALDPRRTDSALPIGRDAP